MLRGGGWGAPACASATPAEISGPAMDSGAAETLVVVRLIDAYVRIDVRTIQKTR